MQGLWDSGTMGLWDCESWGEKNEFRYLIPETRYLNSNYRFLPTSYYLLRPPSRTLEGVANAELRLPPRIQVVVLPRGSARRRRKAIHLGRGVVIDQAVVLVRDISFTTPVLVQQVVEVQKIDRDFKTM